MRAKYDKSIPYKDRAAYSNARAQARYRNEEWAFEIDSWLTFWKTSGFWEHRGKAIHQYCMVRLDEIEAWGPHNCIIVSRRIYMRKGGYEHLLKSHPKTAWQPRHAAGVRND